MCEDDACGHGHSLSSGAGGRRSDPVAAMPGLVFEPRVAKSVVAFMAADSPDKVRHTRQGQTLHPAAAYTLVIRCTRAGSIGSLCSSFKC